MLTSIYRAKNFSIKEDFSTVSGHFFSQTRVLIYWTILYNRATLSALNRKNRGDKQKKS